MEFDQHVRTEPRMIIKQRDSTFQWWTRVRNYTRDREEVIIQANDMNTIISQPWAVESMIRKIQKSIMLSHCASNTLLMQPGII